MTVFSYRPDVLDRLLDHGVRPIDTTRPELVELRKRYRLISMKPAEWLA